MGEILRIQIFETKPMLEYPPRVLYAGGSQRRIAFIEQAFNRSEVASFPVGLEPDVNTIDVMRYKLGVGLESTPEGYFGAIIAADTRTSVPMIVGDTICMADKGKPRNQHELYESFVNMQNVSEFTGENPFYQVQSASGLLHLNGKRVQLEDIHTCLVALKKAGLQTLLTEEGFKKYLEEFAQFYSQPPYSTHNMKPITPADLSGGLSLPVLTKMGIVQSVEGVDIGDNRFRDTLKHNIHVVAVGISPAILTSVQVDPQKAIYEWGWLDEVTDHALEK